MSTERILPEATVAALGVWFAYRGITGGIVGPIEREAMEAAIRAADEKRGLRVEVVKPDPRSCTQFDPEWRYVSDWQSGSGPGELAQADPDGQEYAYRVAYTNRTNGHIWHLGARDIHDAADRHKELAMEGFAAWVERALLGTWERVS